MTCSEESGRIFTLGIISGDVLSSGAHVQAFGVCGMRNRFSSGAYTGKGGEENFFQARVHMNVAKAEGVTVSMVIAQQEKGS